MTAAGTSSPRPCGAGLASRPSAAGLAAAWPFAAGLGTARPLGGVDGVWPGSAGLPERAAARLSYNMDSGWLVAENCSVAASVSARASAE
jgi:hypothetical protein